MVRANTGKSVNAFRIESQARVNVVPNVFARTKNKF
jgi:hypothetical protein